MVAATKKRIVWSVCITFCVALSFVFIGPFIPYKVVKNSICPVSGSTRTEITWLGNFRYEEFTVTALENWLVRREASFKPNWQSLSTQTYFILGKSYGCARAPKIYQLNPILDRVVEKLSDDQIAHFVFVLRNGSQDEQQDLIGEICKEVFD